METRKLNTTDGWEDIVNGNAVNRSLARERVAARKRERKIKKLWIATCALGVASTTFVILGATGAMSCWLASAASIVSLVYASLMLGRYVELKKV